MPRLVPPEVVHGREARLVEQAAEFGGVGAHLPLAAVRREDAVEHLLEGLAATLSGPRMFLGGPSRSRFS